MKADIISPKGTKKGSINFPIQFEEEIRPDLIKRAFLAIQSHKIQPRGTDPEAGKKYSSKLSRRRRDYKGAYGIGISRVPRKILNYRGSRFNWEGATAPNTRGGRQSHPPKVEKDYSKKINKKERQKAIRSAMAASVKKEMVINRGHVVKDYPFVLETSVENIKKTAEVITMFEKIGLRDELKRSERKSEKRGRAKRRGRKYKKAVGPLVVVSKKCDLMKSSSNIPGVDVVEVRSLNVEMLAPGTDVGRLTIYTEDAIKLLEQKKLFTNLFKKETKNNKKEGKKPKKEKTKSNKKKKPTKSKKKIKTTKKATKK